MVKVTKKRFINFSQTQEKSIVDVSPRISIWVHFGTFDQDRCFSKLQISKKDDLFFLEG